MEDIPKIPGCIFRGYASHPDVNNGEAVPLFSFAEPTDRPSINTLEGWNARAKELNLKYFRRRYGRDPHNEYELKRYVNALVDPKNQHLPFDAIGIPEAE